jgi:hypothetical protein
MDQGEGRRERQGVVELCWVVKVVGRGGRRSDVTLGWGQERVVMPEMWLVGEEARCARPEGGGRRQKEVKVVCNGIWLSEVCELP